MNRKKKNKNKTNKSMNYKTIIFIISIVISTASCRIDDPNITTFQKAEILSVDVPDTMTTGQTYSIPINFNRPTSCHSFDEFNIDKDPGEVFVSVVSIFEDTFDCETTNIPIGQVELQYTVEQESDFIFRFFQTTENNQNIYIDKSVVVEN